MAGSDAYRKVGRGGAGNFIQPKKADEASKDLEAQHPDPAEARGPALDRAPAATTGGPAMSRAGRGGAGNYVDAASARQQEQQAAEVTAAAVAGSDLKQQQQRQHAAPHPRLGGRGGAGNWQNSAAAAEDEKRRLEDERRRADELEKLAREEVDRGLRMPDRVHHGEETRKTAASK